MQRLQPSSLHQTISSFLSTSLRRGARAGVEPIRQAMLEALGQDGARLNPALHARLSTLQDAHALWYARAELVAVRSQIDGEAKAVAAVQHLQPVFKGVLPRSMTDAVRLSR